MSTSESKPKPELVSVEAKSFPYAPRISALFMVGGFAAAAAVTGVVVLAALTSWLVLFALFAFPPLMMMVWGPVMIAAMRGPMAGGFWAPRWCAPWLRPDVGRSTLPD